MGYPQEILVGAITRNSNAHDTAEVLTAATGVYGSYTVHYPIDLHAFTFRITTAVDDLTASVLTLQDVDAVADSTTDIVDMTIPDGAAVNKLYRTDFSAYQVEASHLLQMKHTIGAKGGTPAGAGFYGFLASLSPENIVNQTNYVTV